MGSARLHRRCRCMTLKAVHLYARVGMTTLAELASRVDGNGLTSLVVARVAIDTANQAVPFGADPLVYRPVSLMKQEPHMVLAHDVCRFDTTLDVTELRSRRRPGWLGNTAIPSLTGRDNQHTEHTQTDQLHCTGPNTDYSPMPISI